jgi:hypothetical protein
VAQDKQTELSPGLHTEDLVAVHQTMDFVVTQQVEVDTQAETVEEIITKAEAVVHILMANIIMKIHLQFLAVTQVYQITLALMEMALLD